MCRVSVSVRRSRVQASRPLHARVGAQGGRSGGGRTGSRKRRRTPGRRGSDQGHWEKEVLAGPSPRVGVRQRGLWGEETVLGVGKASAEKYLTFDVKARVVEAWRRSGWSGEVKKEDLSPQGPKETCVSCR